MLKLFTAPGSCALASHIALEEAGADYQTINMSLKDGDQRKPEFLAVNPKGRVPALVTDRGILTENPVILGYIAQTYPDAGLAPVTDSFAFGDMQAFNIFLAATVHPAFAHVYRPYRYADGEAAHAAMKAKAPDALAEHFSLIEQKLADGRPWVHGDHYWVSDGYLIVFTRWLERSFPEVAARFPETIGHRRRVEARPATRRVLASAN
jgi:glutathione S-transferase